MKSLFIFRRDFRIIDNTALNYCYKNSDKIIAIFIFTPEQVTKKNTYKSNNAIQFMIESLKNINVTINYCYGDYLKVIHYFANKYKINNVYTNTDYTPYAIKRDKKINKLCKKLNVKFCLYHDITLYVPKTIVNQQNKIYQKFTPFYRLLLSKSPKKINKQKIKNIKFRKVNNKYIVKNIYKFYKKNSKINVNGGRNNALIILKKLNDFKKYGKNRDILNYETTHLSGYLKFGCISIREVYYYFIQKLGKSHDLVKQLIWREFYYHLGYGFINRFGISLKPDYDKIKWINNNTLLSKWQQGKTGFPIIDACMTEINTTGYMHNRGRLIVASFLIKNLHNDWRRGEKYFAQQLLDYDVLVNQGNWQWVAGTGADSQPYFRIFNPWTQSKKFDKNCEYIKYWLPNLKEVNNKHIHEWDKYYNLYDLNKIKYIKPVIDYKKSREIALKMYKDGLK